MQREAFNTDRPALTLPEWAALPLHRLLASAGIDAAGALTRVGGLAAKTAAASQARTVVAFAVHADQVEQCVGPHGSMPAADVVGATTLPTLAGAVEQRTSNAFGTVVELPRVLTETAQPGAGEHWSKSFDYRASSFCRFEWLEALVLGALRAEPVAEAERASPPSGVLCKYARKGYVHVLGTAGCGKTSWALNWVRHSTREYAAGPFPPLAGWYFARREGESAFDHGDEFSALQNLISLARRQLDVLPRPAGSHDPLGTPLRLLSDDERAKHRSRRDPDTDDLLRDRFLLELRWLAQQRPPTAETPLLFLIDGGDEMWGTGAKHQRWDFPRILPTVADLPEHVYIVLLSRPGDHMLGFHGKTPLLRYVFTRADVDRVTRQYLNTQARHLQRRLGPNEASDLLRDEQLQENICNASEGAFGYVTLLLRQWLPDAPDRVDQQLDLLRRWRHQQDTLPEGIYGLRAREFMTMLGQPLHSHPAASEQDDPGLAKALALITQLRWPLSRSQLLWLLYPNTLPGETDPPGAKALRARLQQGGGWLAGVDMDADHEPMYFGHQSLREVVLAAWRLHARRVACNEATLSEEARALATERNEFDAEPESPLDQERQRADATLHAVLAGASNPEREPTWVKQVRGQATKPVVRPQERLDTAQAYDWTWGPLHALKAGAAVSDGVISSGNAAGGRRHELAAQARDALVDAGYLQSAMRAQVAYAKQRGDAPSALALRDTFIAADALTGEDNERSLRHRVESALLHWHEHIAEGRLQVGVMLWNLLGADDQGKDHAERWKTSLDRPAIIASLPGRPSDLVRQIPAAASAITPCGNWLVTSDGLSKTEIWDLRQGWHRAWLRWRLSWVLGPRIEAAAIGTELGVGGVDAQQHRDLVMGVVDLDTGQHDLARYVGHGAWVRTVSLKCHTDRQQVVWALGSGSDDHSVGLLLRTTKQIVNDSRTSGAAQGAPVSGVIARYAGHRAPVASVSLQAQYDGQRMVWALASGSFDHTVGLLLRTREQVVEDSRVSGAGHGVPVPGVLVRYAGHRSAVTSISLQAHYDGRRLSWVLGSGSHDFTVGLLLRTLEQINFEASKQARGEAINGALARYGGHVMNVNSVCLQGLSEGLCTTWVLASGSSDNTVGMLLRTSQQIEDDSRHSGADRVWPNGGTLARYVLRGGTGASVSLQCTHDGQRSICALACGSGNWGAHFGHLLVRTVQEIEQDARHSSEMERWTPNPGLEALFPLPRDVRGSLSLACKRRGQHIVWAVASLSELRPVGLIEMPRRQIDDGVRRSRESRDSTISPVLARYAGHGSRVRSVDLGCVQDGQAKVWALASGSDDSTVGLLIRTREQIGSDVLSSGADREVPNCGVLERYTGHSFEVASVSLRGHHDGEHVTWAVASGSYDGTVGLLLRPSEDSTANTRRTSAVRRFTTSMHNRRVVRKIISYARRWGLMRKQPKVGMLVRYGGHGDFVTAVSLDYQHNGEASMLAVASGTYGGSVGLLLRSLEQLQHDAQNSFAEDDTPNPGVLARYAGHGDTVRCVSIAGQHDGEQKVWALASGAVDCTVGVLLRTAEQIGEDSNRSTSEITVPNPCVLARQLAHSLPLGAVSLQFQRVGQQAVCAVASGSFDRTVGLLLRTPKQIGEEAAQAPEPHQSRHTLTRGTGLAECVSLRRIDWPCEALGIPQSKTAAYWLGGNAEALMIWSADLEATSRSNRADEGDHVASLPGLMPRLVCPLGAVDLEVMAFAGSPDGMEYAVGGAVGLDVAIMMLEVRLPEP